MFDFGRRIFDHVWSYDFVRDRTSEGRTFRLLTLIDEYRRECLSIDVARSLTSEDVLGAVDDAVNHPRCARLHPILLCTN